MKILFSNALSQTYLLINLLTVDYTTAELAVRLYVYHAELTKQRFAMATPGDQRETVVLFTQLNFFELVNWRHWMLA